MTRDELLAAAKPILFNTEMVRAILDGRKTETRRVIKLKYDNTHIKIRKEKYGESVIEIQNDIEGETFGTNPDGSHWHNLLAYIEKNPPHRKGDILYVRETWCKYSTLEDDKVASPKGTGQYYYRADGGKPIPGAVYLVQRDGYDECFDYPKWHPSIHMPKEAARLFLRVKRVRAERLQDITEEGAKAEGIRECYIGMSESGFAVARSSNSFYDCAKGAYSDLWENTIPKKNRALYGWDADPWVWVIEFERISDNG